MTDTDIKQSDTPEKGGWYKAGDTDLTTSTPEEEKEEHTSTEHLDSVEWTASEFIAHDKGPFWYIIFGGSTIVVALLLQLITRDLTNTIVTLVIGTAIGVAASRPPRILPYRLDRRGITIGKAFHPFSAFKSYAVINEGAFSSITFVPLKRLEFPLSIYFSPEDEHKIMEVLSNYLPMEQGSLDYIDQFARKIHF